MQSWGLTDPGCVRKQNQDAYQIEQLDKNSLLCIVCDGMGGAKSGNIASSLAVDVFVEEVRRCWKPKRFRTICVSSETWPRQAASYSRWPQALRRAA